MLAEGTGRFGSRFGGVLDVLIEALASWEQFGRFSPKKGLNAYVGNRCVLRIIFGKIPI